MAGVLLVLIAGITWFFLGGSHTARADLILHRVTRGPLQITVIERGKLESANNKDVYCRVKTGGGGGSGGGGGGAPQIKELYVLDGDRVKKGDLLMQIEDARFQDARDAQQISVDKAESAMNQAKESLKIVQSQNDSDILKAEVDYQLAQLELEKYLKGDYLQKIKDLQGQLKIAEFELEQWKDRASWSQRMVLKGYLTPSQAQAEESRLQSAQITRERLLEARRVLDDPVYGEKKATETQMTSKIRQAEQALARTKTATAAAEAKAKNELDTCTLVYERVEKQLKDILLEIEKCKIVAPQDGLVVYYVPEGGGRGGGSTMKMIAQGETVSEGQKLMQIPDMSQMVVNTRVHEALVSRLRLGQEAEVRVDAFQARTLKGKVKSIANVAAKPDNWSSADVMVYPTVVDLEDEFEGLRPGMNAQVTIFTDNPLESVLTVPVQAIVGSASMGQTPKVFVMGPDGLPQQREIVVGLFNEVYVEVRDGLEEGEMVVVNPKVIVGDTMKTRKAGGDNRPTDNGRQEDGPRPGASPGEEPGVGSPDDSGPDGPTKGQRGKGGKRGAGKKGGPPPVDVSGG